MTGPEPIIKGRAECMTCHSIQKQRVQDTEEGISLQCLKCECVRFAELDDLSLLALTTVVELGAG